MKHLKLECRRYGVELRTSALLLSKIGGWWSPGVTVGFWCVNDNNDTERDKESDKDVENDNSASSDNDSEYADYSNNSEDEE